jgi:hypothetical protein
MGGRGSCRAETTAIGDWRLATGKIASGNGFDHPPEVSGCEIKSRLKPAKWVARCGLRVEG